MTAYDYAGKAVRLYHAVEPDMSIRDCIASVIREAQADAYRSVLSLLEEHKECETCVVIDELEDQIKQTMTDP